MPRRRGLEMLNEYCPVSRLSGTVQQARHDEFWDSMGSARASAEVFPNGVLHDQESPCFPTPDTLVVDDLKSDPQESGVRRSKDDSVF